MSCLHIGITTGTCQAELGATLLQYGLSPWQGLGIELLLTFLFIFCVCATIDPNRTDGGGKALMIGFAMAGCHLAGFRFTGASMNPARSLGPAFVANKWSHHWCTPSAGGLCLLFLQRPPLLQQQPLPSHRRRQQPPGQPPQLSARRGEPQWHGCHHNHPHHQHPPTTCTPNLYAPGTFRGANSHRHPGLSQAPASRRPHVPATAHLRRGGANDDVILPPPRRPPPQHDDAIYGRRNPLNDVTPGRENQAYAFDSNPRRLQSPGASTPRDIMQMFSDGRETICLNDVRVF
ncbi:hypothetical protein C0Q70_07598 [Pomacea canaliculata]|uniref:Aquaporin n=1 Tax=Pomacea canaliculata TaxID=400727 RepID=A0A2T7PFH6_POMCA|nr:hypothetical protein C0Q70_07598 [Pomacea canaliculata]